MERCKICNKEFNTVRGLSGHIKQKHNLSTVCYYDEYLKKENEGICLCGKLTSYRGLFLGYSKYCSNKCAGNDKNLQEQIKQTNLKRYGTTSPLKSETIKKKIKQTNLERYGVENVFANDKIKEKIKQTNNEKYGVNYVSQFDTIKEKKKQTLLLHYGVKNPSQSKIINEKKKQTNNEKYGVEYASQSDIIKEKTKQTCLKKYGTEYVFQNEDVKNKIKETNYLRYNTEYPIQNELIKEKSNITKINNWFPYFNEKINEYNLKLLDKSNENFTLKCMKCDNIFTFANSTIYNYLRFNIDICPFCFPRENISIKEKELVDYIKTIYKGEIIENDRIILKGQELDIYLPDLKIAFEYNGLYWHSDLYKNKEYHYNKTIECEKQDIQLVHIFENEWLNNKNKIKEYINNLIFNNDILNNELSFRKEDDKIVVDRSLNNGKILEKEGYVLTETIKPKNKNITYKNKNYEIYDCGYLIYKHI